MPSHTAASALIKLYFVDGAPWKWPAWQARTNIKHGLFPPDDKHLPPGFSREDAIDVESYFKAYNSLPNEDDKIKFATKAKGGAIYPGRRIWNGFVTKNWGNWGLHTVIVTELKDANVHPQDILIREPNLPLPASDFYVPLILDSLGLKLFGEEAFPDNSDLLPTDLRLCLTIIVQRSWRNIRRQLSALKSRAAKIEKTARDAFQELEGQVERPLKSQVNKTIRAVAKWKECAEVLNTPSNVATAMEMLGALQGIMEMLGARISAKTQIEPGETRVLCKVSTQALRDLARMEDVTDLLNTYREYFEMDAEEEPEPPIPVANDFPHAYDVNEDGDIGMEVEAKMSSNSLMKVLGFKLGIPPSFNKYRFPSGFLLWDFSDDTPCPAPEEMEEIKLHWHQLAGVHSIIRHVFVEGEDSDLVPGMLISDEVGLGKTAQAIATIALLNQIIYAQKNKLECPPIIAARPLFLGLREVPSHPHLILCPGTLVAQWINELKVFFRPRSVDILVFDSKVDSTYFWGPTGPIHSSIHEPHHRIVIATHSAVFNDFRNKHKKIKTKNLRPWSIPPANRQINGSIFEQSFLTIIIDEAHHMRVPGNNHLAALRLACQAKMRLVMTATPLYTAPRDISSMGRLVGIPHFLNEDSFIEEKKDVSTLRRLKKYDDNGAAYLSEQLKIVRRLQAHCQPFFLRRSPTSVDFQGQSLLPLPPYHEIIGMVDLSERELNIIKDRAKAAKALMLNANPNGIRTRSFYLEYRLAVGYAKADPDSLWPTFRSLEEWEPVKSTKMEVLAQLCVHYLSHNDVQDVTFEEGKPVFPPIPELKDEKTQRTRQIIVYGEFPSMAPLLQNILKLYDVESLVIHGEISFQLRAKRVKDFVNPQHPARVLIFSSVGGVGLNLSIADVVIFFDQPWSAQDVRQIRGRVHRQPQQKEVKSIHILANNSSDPLMYSVACGKNKLYEAFVKNGLGDDLRTLLQGQIPDDYHENEAEELDNDSVIRSDSKLKKRRHATTSAVKEKNATISTSAKVNKSTGLSEGGALADPMSPVPPTDIVNNESKHSQDNAKHELIKMPASRSAVGVDNGECLSLITASIQPHNLPPPSFFIALPSNQSKHDANDPSPNSNDNRGCNIDDNANMVSPGGDHMPMSFCDGHALSEGIPNISGYETELESREGFLTSATVSEDGDMPDINDREMAQGEGSEPIVNRTIVDTRKSPGASPPLKRARHGTIGEESRNNLLAASMSNRDINKSSNLTSNPVVLPIVKTVTNSNRIESGGRQARAHSPYIHQLTGLSSRLSLNSSSHTNSSPLSSSLATHQNITTDVLPGDASSLRVGQQPDHNFIPGGHSTSPHHEKISSQARARLDPSQHSPFPTPRASSMQQQQQNSTNTQSGGSRVPPKSALKGRRMKH